MPFARPLTPFTHCHPDTSRPNHPPPSCADVVVAEDFTAIGGNVIAAAREDEVLAWFVSRMLAAPRAVWRALLNVAALGRG